MRLRSVLWAAVARYRYRRRCEDDAEAYARQPLTEAEVAVGDDPRDWAATARW